MHLDLDQEVQGSYPIVGMKADRAVVHVPLCPLDFLIEFYTTLEVNAKNSQILEFRMEGKPHQLTYSFMNRVFGFKKDGLYEPPSSYK